MSVQTHSLDLSISNPSWTRLADMNEARFSPTMVPNVDATSIFVFGDQSDIIEKYDIDQNNWETITETLPGRLAVSAVKVI